MNRRFSAIGCAIDCLGFDVKRQVTELSPAALRKLGLVERLAAHDLGDAEVRIDAGNRDPRWGVVSFSSVLRTTDTLRRTVCDLQRDGHRLLVVGGCCTQLMGVLAGSRDALGEVGVAYADGHLDLYDGQSSPTGEAADMPLAAIPGKGPAPLLHALGPGQVVANDSAFLFDYRDLSEAAARGSLLPEDIGSEFRHLDAESLRRRGMKRSGESIARSLAESAGRFWLHIDIDILSQEEFPATDYLMSGGLT